MQDDTYTPRLHDESETTLGADKCNCFIIVPEANTKEESS